MAVVFSGSLVFVILILLFLKSAPILGKKPLPELIFSSTWLPFQGEFGFYPFIIGTIYVTLLAMVFSIPLSVLSAVYLAEYADKRIKKIIKPLIDLLAGIPPVIYGVWGILVIVPFIAEFAPFVKNSLGFIPLLSSGSYVTGYSILAGGIVLAIMVLPIIISVIEEVFNVIPSQVRESSLSLGATKWQTIKHVLVRGAMPGIVAAIILGFSRAFGETMAVLMVVGNVIQIPSSVFDPAYPLPALIANNYGEMMSIPLYDSALMLASLILLVIIMFFSIIARIVLLRIERRLIHG